MKHTPGPWKIKEQDIIGNEQNGYICTWSGRKADAHLIASAPKLLEACNYIRKVLLIIERTQALPVPTILRNNIECLDQTIAKAEGGKK